VIEEIGKPLGATDETKMAPQEPVERFQRSGIDAATKTAGELHEALAVRLQTIEALPELRRQRRADLFEGLARPDHLLRTPRLGMLGVDRRPKAVAGEHARQIVDLSRRQERKHDTGKTADVGGRDPAAEKQQVPSGGEGGTDVAAETTQHVPDSPTDGSMAPPTARAASVCRVAPGDQPGTSGADASASIRSIVSRRRCTCS